MIINNMMDTTCSKIYPTGAWYALNGINKVTDYFQLITMEKVKMMRVNSSDFLPREITL